MIQSGYTPPPRSESRAHARARRRRCCSLALLVFGLLIDRTQFFHAYLVGFIFWIGITLGSLALLMLQHLTGGAWGLIIRRVLEAATRTLPLMVILFIPILVGLESDLSLDESRGNGPGSGALREDRSLFESGVLHDSRGCLFRALVADGVGCSIGFHCNRIAPPMQK